MTFSIPYRSLREAARQDRGTVVYGDGQVIVCDWAADCPRGGLPVLSWREGLRPSMDDVDHGAILEMYKEAVDDIRLLLPPLDWGKVYDPNGELSTLLSGDDPKNNGLVHVVRCYGLAAIVRAPPVWRVRDRLVGRLPTRSGLEVFVQRRVAYGYVFSWQGHDGSASWRLSARTEAMFKLRETREKRNTLLFSATTQVAETAAERGLYISRS